MRCRLVDSCRLMLLEYLLMWYFSTNVSCLVLLLGAYRAKIAWSAASGVSTLTSFNNFLHTENNFVWSGRHFYYFSILLILS